MPGRSLKNHRRLRVAPLLLAVAAMAPGAAAVGAVPSAQLVGAPCVSSTRGAADDGGRLVQCLSTAAGKVWVWSAAVPVDLSSPPVPSSWSAVVPSTTGADADVPVPALPGQYTNRAAMEARLVELTNQLRAERGLRPLIIDPRLTRLARRWAEQTGQPEFAGRGTAHCPPTLCAVRAAEIGYPSFGEVIRPWNPFPKGDMADERFFIDSPRHVAILTNERVTHIGFGVHIVGDPSAPESVVVVGQVGRSR
jgi:uncharacterized protein YkwD